MHMIEVGMYVKYESTGTIGKIVELTIINGKNFALIDTTGLYYDVSYLEQTTKPLEKQKVISSNFDTIEKANSDLIDSLNNGEMSENVGGG